MGHERGVMTRPREFARSKGATPAQIALAWVLAHGDWIVPIPGTTKLSRLKENLGSANVELTPYDLDALNELTANVPIHGERYSEGAQKLINR
jgi:aryl-alcohol dehydrogenase-like predicted oxidoreductase